MVFQAGKRDPRTWDVARLSERVKIHSPAARVFLRFPKVSRQPSCMDHAILHGKSFGIPLLFFGFSDILNYQGLGKCYQFAFGVTGNIYP